MSEKNNASFVKKFREYTAAIIDKETSKAAELYANYSDDETFINIVKAYHAMVDGFKEGQRIGSIEFLKEELYMTDYDIKEIEQELAGSESTIVDFAAAMMDLHRNINKKGCKMSVWELQQILKSDEFREIYWGNRDKDEPTP